MNRLSRAILKTIAVGTVLFGTAACTSAPLSEHRDDIGPRALASAGCPDFSGRYAGTGVLMDDNDANHRPSSIRDLDNVFPPLINDEWNSLQKNYRRDSRGLERHPDTGVITADASGQYTISFFYGRSLIGAYRSGLASQRTNSRCEQGRLVIDFGSEKTRSDYGANNVKSQNVISVDEAGNLIFESSFNVSYSMELLHIPMGSGDFQSKYVFKRIRD